MILLYVVLKSWWTIKSIQSQQQNCSTKNRRSLGIGYIGLAHYLAKQGVKYDDPAAWKAVHDLSESFQYYLLKSSNTLAKEKGPCGYFDRTKYADGILPIDTYKRDIDEFCGT